ncbi:MAG: hypothetical protein A2746_01335 [Candidatus Yanofskybacteria bacterium RIFCSPHIGHO2_01_FULL_44_22]|uniref:VTT domain-containing protein n=1 Tax=Candidatus Yanofskybacteria bacterium RIFCSPHIGHO2_01_FULL_44_22 TaxID=1802669 RepID=A0A1F8EY57_9BACT|nr:MAG: hypothetical protein A2746_01335 [Candidatus Yanofskybacteria bacterium RIFCSPHIGHO2_01_FULL_44_22]
MEGLLNFFQDNFPFLISHRYLFLFLGGAIEGLNTMVLGGFLASVGGIALLPIFFIFVAGYTLNGYIWYLVGYLAGAKPIDKWGRKDPKSRKIIEKVEEYFERYSGRAIVITKFTFSLTIATLIMAGSLKYNLKKFSWYNFLGSIGWVAVTLFIGYFFGQSYKFFLVYLRNLTYFIVFLGGAVALIYLLKLFFKSTFVRTLFISEKIKEFSEKIKDGFDKFLSDR